MKRTLRSVVLTLLGCAALIYAAYQLRLGIKDRGVGELEKRYELWREEQERLQDSLRGAELQQKVRAE